METYSTMQRARLAELLDKMRGARVALIGDLCLDVYWLADMKKSELSRETPHFPLPIAEERLSLGGGANAAANLAALRPAKVSVAGVVGADWRGAELLRLLDAAGIDSSRIVTAKNIWTNAYCKPLRAGISELIYEDPRLDFCNYRPPDSDTEDRLIESLGALAPEIDVLCVSDQLPFGAVTERVREKIIALARNGLRVVADSRDRIGLYTDVILKPNEVEAARAADMPPARDLNGFAEIARRFSRTSGCEVMMTVGSFGSLYADGDGVTHIPARAIPGEIDIVGAGDSFLSGFALGVAAGASRPEAAFFAGLCSAVTIQQIGVTGVAAPEQVLAWFERNYGNGVKYEGRK